MLVLKEVNSIQYRGKSRNSRISASRKKVSAEPKRLRVFIGASSLIHILGPEEPVVHHGHDDHQQHPVGGYRRAGAQIVGNERFPIAEDGQSGSSLVGAAGGHHLEERELLEVFNNGHGNRDLDHVFHIRDHNGKEAAGRAGAVNGGRLQHIPGHALQTRQQKQRHQRDLFP